MVSIPHSLPGCETIPTGRFCAWLSDEIQKGLQKILDDTDLGTFFKTMQRHSSEEDHLTNINTSIGTIKLPEITMYDDCIKVSFDGKVYDIQIMNLDSKYLPETLRSYGTGRIEADGTIKILAQIPENYRKYAAIHESYDAHLKALDTPDPEDHMYQAEQMVFKQACTDMRQDPNFDIPKFIASRVGFFVGAYGANIDDPASQEHNKIIKDLLEHKLPILNKWLYSGKQL